MMGTIKDKLGRPIRDLRISVTDRCNFRCPYCMPSEIYGKRYKFLPKVDLITFEEIARLARVFADLGVRKLRLTGGEPLLRNGLEDLISTISKTAGIEEIALTTNGYLLAERAKTLKEAGLKRVTVSLDSMDDEVVKESNGRGYSVSRIIDGIKKAEMVGLTPIKINAVVKRGLTDTTIVDLARRFKGTPHIVRFIEYMDVGNLNGWTMENVMPAADIFDAINREFPIEPIEPNYESEVSQRYRYKDGTGEIGIISSVTNPFCQTCSRARISTDGKFYTCLFATEGTDLRTALRGGARDDELVALITGIWRNREDRYSEIRTSFTRMRNRPKKVEMYQIGG